MVALVLDGLVGFPGGLSPTSFHLSPSSFHLSPRLGACGRVPGWLSPTSFHLSPKLGACGRVPGWLVSHFLSFVSHFFICFPLLFICLPSWVLVVGFPAGLSPLSFVSHFFSFVSQAGCLWSGSRLACLPLPFICFPLLFICLPSWVLVVGFPAGLSPTSFPLLFICLPVLFICPGWVLVVGFAAGLSPTSFHLYPTSFICLPLLFIVSQAGCLWWVPSRLVSHFFSFVSQAGRLWSGSWLACLPLPFILSPTSFHLSPTHPRNRPSLQAQRVSSPGRGPPVKGSRPFERGA